VICLFIHNVKNIFLQLQGFELINTTPDVHSISMCCKWCTLLHEVISYIVLHTRGRQFVQSDPFSDVAVCNEFYSQRS